MSNGCSRCQEFPQENFHLVTGKCLNDKWVCQTCLTPEEKIELAGVGDAMAQILRERAISNRFLVFLITLAIHRNFKRVAHFLAWVYHSFYGHYAFRRVAPILGLDVILVSKEQRGNSPYDFAIIGKLSSGENFRYSVGHKSGFRISCVDRTQGQEIFEMPLPHVKRELNIPEENNGRGASKAGAVLRYRSINPQT